MGAPLARRRLALIALAGAAAVLLFDVVAATLVRRHGIDEDALGWGVFAIYALAGLLAAHADGLPAAAAMGLLLGLVEAVVGRVVWDRLGPPEPASPRVLALVLVVGAYRVGVALVWGCIGGAAGALLRRARSDPRRRESP